MRLNIGRYERLVRVLLGIFLVILAFSQYFKGYQAWFAAFVGIILFITGVVGWCGIYSLFKISTKGTGINKISRKDIEFAVKNRSIYNTDKKIEIIKPQKNKVVSKKSESKTFNLKKDTEKSLINKKVSSKKKIVKKKESKKLQGKKDVVKKKKQTSKSKK